MPPAIKVSWIACVTCSVGDADAGFNAPNGWFIRPQSTSPEGVWAGVGSSLGGVSWGGWSDVPSAKGCMEAAAGRLYRRPAAYFRRGTLARDIRPSAAPIPPPE